MQGRDLGLGLSILKPALSHWQVCLGEQALVPSLVQEASAVLAGLGVQGRPRRHGPKAWRPGWVHGVGCWAPGAGPRTCAPAHTVSEENTSSFPLHPVAQGPHDCTGSSVMLGEGCGEVGSELSFPLTGGMIVPSEALLIHPSLAAHWQGLSRSEDFGEL